MVAETYQTRIQFEGTDRVWRRWDMGWHFLGLYAKEDGGGGLGAVCQDGKLLKQKRSALLHDIGDRFMTLVNDPAIPAAGSMLAYNFYISGVVDGNGYYFKDHLGSTRRLRAQDKSSQATYEYTPYGDVYAHYGGAEGPKFTGHMWDSYMGMYFAPYRWYSPATARWLTRDPLGMIDGPNVYAYAGSSPANSVDMLGMSILRWFPRPGCIRRTRELAKHYFGMYKGGYGHDNYMRHCVAQCHLTFDKGRACAWAADKWHEHIDPIRNRQPKDPVDSSADLHNSRIGRQCGMQVCSDSWNPGRDCRKCCLKREADAVHTAEGEHGEVVIP